MTILFPSLSKFQNGPVLLPTGSQHSLRSGKGGGKEGNDSDIVSSASSSSLSLFSSPAFPPTLIQLYTWKYLNFISNDIQSIPTTRYNVSVSNTYTTNNNNNNNNTMTTLKTSSTTTGTRRPFEILSYQAVQVGLLEEDLVELEKELQPKKPSKTSPQNPHHDYPNWGVWDCQVLLAWGESEKRYIPSKDRFLSPVLQTILLWDPSTQTPEQNNTLVIPTFLVSIDLEDPTTVHAQMTSIIPLILQYGITMSLKLTTKGNEWNSVHPETDSFGTRLDRLANVSFGQVPSSDSLPSSSSSSSVVSSSSSILNRKNRTTEEKDKEDETVIPNHSIPIRLILCAILPSYDSKQNARLTFRDKQAQRLVQYHLHKYAEALNCTLIYVSTVHQKTDTLTTSSHTRVSKQDLSSTVTESDRDPDSIIDIHRTSQSPMGIPVHAVASIAKTIGSLDTHSPLLTSSLQSMVQYWNDQQSATSTVGSIYLPNHHDLDFIDHVLLRNAHCSGLWDARIDPLWNAFTTMDSDGRIDLDANKMIGSSSSVSSIMTSTTTAKGTNLTTSALPTEQDWLHTLAESVAVLSQPNLQHHPIASDLKSVASESSSIPTVTISTAANTTTTATTTTTSKKPHATTTKRKPNASNVKKVGDTDVTHFFEDLLKK